MSQKLICIHGNPGLAKDFSYICRDPFFSNREKLFFDGAKSSNASLSEDMEQLSALVDNGTFDLLCYSWGSYLAIKFLIESGKKANNIILLNPTLKTEDGVSGVVRSIAATPILGSFLLGRLAPGLTRDFIAKSFAPATPKESLSNELTAALSLASVWKRAMSRKQQMFSNPIGDIGEIANKIQIVRGADDQSVLWDVQLPVVQKLQNRNTVELNVVSGAGHNLLWSHLTETIDVIRGTKNGEGDS